MVLEITPIPCLRDNYAYLITAGGTESDATAWVVDPSEAGPVRDALRQRNLHLAGVLATHHHPDHVGGIPDLVDETPALEVLGFAGDAERIPGITRRVPAETGTYRPVGLDLFGVPLQAMHIPGHTTGAVAWKLGDDVFTGDTLFAAGCGRLFEGTPAMMYASLQALCADPPHTRLWFGHEYTAANLRFAAHAEPDNEAVALRAADLAAYTTPTTVAKERATNPFVRARDAEELGARRRAKDDFRS